MLPRFNACLWSLVIGSDLGLCRDSCLLDICLLAAFLLNQIYKQDVRPNVSTCGYDIGVP